MATAYIGNYLGDASHPDTGERGDMLYYAGQGFWLPFEAVTPIPNMTFRELNHSRSTAERGETSELLYDSVNVSGQMIARSLTENQIPYPNKDKGIIMIDGKSTGKSLTVNAGITADGEFMTVDVPEKEATRPEIERGRKLALDFKHLVIQEFFKDKRVAMTGKPGRMTPNPLERKYMEELNVQDIDDVTTHQKESGGINAELIKLIIEETQKAGEVNASTLREAIATVRKQGKAQVSRSRPVPLNLKKNAEEYDKAKAEEQKV